MTKVLIHELPERAEALLTRLSHVLQSDTGTPAADLLARARVESSEKPRMVLTGQYSSGKSKLIEALTDGVVVPGSAADIATDKVTEYPWDGAVILVDTPGVQSGLRTHDERANEAIGTADFILFVITVNLFDDASRDYLQYLANELQLHGQMIMVITQTSKRGAAEGVRQQAVKDALGTSTFNLPIAEVDSVFYLRSLEEVSNAQPLRERSGIDELRAIINKISEDRGDLAKLRQPFHLIRQLCDEAQLLFVKDDHLRSALTLLAAQKAAVSQRRFMLEQAFLTAEAQFKSRCLVDVTGFVDTATSLPAGDEAQSAMDAAETRLVESLERHAGQFADSINRLAEVQFDTLMEQLLEISESNRVERLLRPSADVALDSPDRVRDVTSERPTIASGTPAVDWRRVSELLKKGQGWWGAGDGLRDASGSIGHKLVKDVGHTFNHKFKPWQALKIADKIGKAAKVGGFVIQVGVAGYDVWKNEREARNAQIESERQHAALVTEIMGHADVIAANARQQLWAIIDPPMDEFIAEIQAAQDEILSADQARDETATELRAITIEADQLLAQSSENEDR
ncbi:MAG: 50S ribosome-binding GTPase [Cryobacterium sp.]|nr:50S ribosome-binding GTPase [Cryobacterium sp.]